MTATCSSHEYLSKSSDDVPVAYKQLKESRDNICWVGLYIAEKVQESTFKACDLKIGPDRATM